MQQKQYQLEQIDSPILAIAPIQTAENNLYILSQNGYLYHYQSREQQLQCIYPDALTLPILNQRELRHYGTPTYNMTCSANGKFIAIFVDYGQFGIVFDVDQQCVVLNLNTQDYYEDTVAFSLAFTTLQHDDIIIYRSDWNRLDSFNLSQNISTTARYIAPYERENRPEHYLDYFHGALYVSPNGESILDNGWVWQPVAIPHVWSISAWLTQNPFESEDGTSLKRPCLRDSWDYPMCWLDNETIALWHIKLWDEDEFDVQNNPPNKHGLHIIQPFKESMWDENYVANYWEMPEQTQKIFNLYVDAHQLIIVGNENISVYDIANRNLITQVNNHLAQKQQLKNQCLWAFADHQLTLTYYNNID